jgi:hypothetical protein
LRVHPALLACLIATSCFLAPPRASSNDWQNPNGVCVDSRGCGSGGSSGSDAFSSGPPNIAWGKMTKRAVDGIEACGSSPGCVLLRTATWLPMGLLFDAPVFIFKGVVNGGYYGAKGLYYGARGLGKGLAYAGMAVGRGIAYPFNRPPKPSLPPTTWEQYKHDVLRYQKSQTRIDKANKENQLWCMSRVPLAVSAVRSEWETRCNPGDAVSRSALHVDVLANALAPVGREAASIAAPVVIASISPAAAATASLIAPALQDPAKALAGNDPEVKTAGSGGFDNSRPMVGKQAPGPNPPDGIAADNLTTPKLPVQPTLEPSAATVATPLDGVRVEVPSTSKPTVLPPPVSSAAAASAPQDTVAVNAESSPKSAPSKTSPLPSTGVGVAAAPPAVKPLTPPAAPPTAPVTVAFVLPKFVAIYGDKEFKRKTARDLEIISKTTTGQALLKSLESSGRKLKILSDSGAGNETESFPVTWNDALKAKKRMPGAGSKTDVSIKYSPDRTNVVFLGPPYSDKDVKWTREPNRPSHVGLFHEMVHADDMMHGTIDISTTANVGKRAGDSVAAFEMRAVGLDGVKRAFDENSYRRELKLPERDFY